MAKGVKGSSPTEDQPKRTSIIVRPSKWDKIRYVAFMEKREISDLLDEAMDDVIKKWEKKNGPITIK